MPTAPAITSYGQTYHVIGRDHQFVRQSHPRSDRRSGFPPAGKRTRAGDTMNTATPALAPQTHDDPTTGEEPGYVEWVREQIAQALAETGPGKEHDQFMAEMRQRILSRAGQAQ